MRNFILYFQPECHLCDEAEAMLHVAGLGESYQKINIENKPELLMQYEIHIPVVKRSDTQDELFWPFDQAQLKAFLEIA
jgi:hypothetical protein